MTKRDYLLNEYIAPGPIQQIQIEVCQKYGLTLAEMIGAQRAQRICRPRYEAMYRAKKETTASLPMIGRAFGGRDHTTVLHAIWKHELRLQDGEVAA